MKICLNLLFALFLYLVLPSCSAPKVTIPSDVLSEAKMVSIMSDIQIAESVITFNFTNKDTSKMQADAFYDFIYKNHKTTKEQFNKSFDFYLSQPEILNKIYDEVLVELSKRQGQATKKN